MKRILSLCIIFMLLCITSYSQPYGQLIRGVKPNGTYEFIQLDSSGNMKITGSMTLDNTGVINGIASTNTKLDILNVLMNESISTTTYQLITVTDVATTVVNLPGRKFVSFQNVGTGTVTISTLGNAVSGQGKYLYSQGTITNNKYTDAVTISLISASGQSNIVGIEQGK